MKYAVILGDGMSDYPIKELGDKTPLTYANTPNMDHLADHALHYGLAHTTLQDLPAGSDVANLSVLGYDPEKYYTGRGPLEAGSMGVKLKQDDIAFRCNLITIENENISDYSAGHITSEEAAVLMKYLDENLGDERVRFYPGISYRHLLVINKFTPDTLCTPPHDVLGQPVADNLPEGEGSEEIIELIKKSRNLLKDHPVNKKRIAAGKNPANSIWPWGQGKTPSMPSFREKYNINGSVISAVDLIKGLGVFSGLEVINVPGATGYLDTDYEAKARYALESLKSKDFVFIHVEAADEASHEGKLKEKIMAIEDLDKKVVGTMLEGMKAFGEFKLMVLPDHPTPLSIKTHARDPVPYVIYYSGHNNENNISYDEMSMKKGLLIKEGYRLMDLFIKGSL
ncbi:cofactor-independent phosphoglycerate mutase [Methanocella sp. CWC-04]|uniref:phosphoglycerate mutase (2,3-diphosphoglycerate-independent) n=1 Tax=Methanooceanicella nereidis TaxID=2052831 RepID=A0AAP2RF13_9EURY|nr:cofactor-independent phosphoglycerate mutase [Methanocella sp. CWC-04]MCD1296133.1 cofactor-independent phosphoglycerate mutase [Methanocella sp. CWC-04]